MDNQGDKEQSKESANDSRHRSRPAEPFEIFEKGEPIGKTDREEKLGHHRIGKTKVAVVVFENRKDFFETAQIVDKGHGQYGPAPELVEETTRGVAATATTTEAG